jgi:hypothetical protein
MNNSEIKDKINLAFHEIEYAGRLGQSQETLKDRYHALITLCDEFLSKNDPDVFQRKYAETIKNSCLFSVFFMSLSKKDREKFDDLNNRSLGIYGRKK